MSLNVGFPGDPVFAAGLQRFGQWSYPGEAVSGVLINLGVVESRDCPAPRVTDQPVHQVTELRHEAPLPT